MKQKIFTLLSALLFMSSGVWAYEGQVLFSQNFNSATAVAYAENTARAYTTADGKTLSGLVGIGAHLFTSITCNAKSSCGIGINTTTGGNSKDYTGKFGAYYNNSSGYWSICKTSNFATTAPTAVKIEFNAAFAYVSSGTNTGVQIAIGSGYTDGLTNSCPALANCVAGFSWPSNKTIKISKYVVSNGITNLSSNTLTDGASNKYTWIINNTSESLSYIDPKGESNTVAANCWDLWVGTTLYCDDVTKATTGMSGTSLQNIYIGSPFGKKNEFILDDITVTDLTPNTSDGATFNASGWNTFASSSKLDLSNITGGTAYVAKEVNGSNKVVLTPCTDIVAAETGIMVKKEGTATKFYIAKTTEEVTSPAADNLLVGVTSATDVPVSTASDYYYVYGWTDPADPGFYKVDGDQPNLPANRAYLHTTKELAARLALDFEEGDVTGISEISRQQLKANGQFFNLSGQRVSANHKGIVIVNGKKYFNK